MERSISILERRVGSLTFKNPLLFGGGCCKTLADVSKACGTDAGGLEIGTITKLPRAGNPGPNNFHAVWVKGVLIYTLNSLGMPNPGKDYWTIHAKEAIRRAHDVGQKIGINIAGDTPKEIIEMVLWAMDMGFDWITINGGCPNKFGIDGKPLGTLTFDEGALEQLVDGLERNFSSGDGEVWWKGSPHTDTMGAFPRGLRIIGDSNIITGCIANNTVPHCFTWNEDGSQTISAGDGRAGMGGPAVKPLALGHLRAMEGFFPRHKVRIGSGGTCFGSDIADYLRMKADLVQMTSWVWANNMNYGVANQALAELMEQPDLEEILAL